MIQQYLNEDAFENCKKLDDNCVNLLFTGVPDMSNIQGPQYKKEEMESYNIFLENLRGL